MKIDLPDENGNVISIEVARRNMRERQMRRQCTHHRIAVDTSLSHLKCLDCGADLNPVEWVAMMAEEWHRIQILYEGYKQARQELSEKQRVRCKHCGQMTPVGK